MVVPWAARDAGRVPGVTGGRRGAGEEWEAAVSGAGAWASGGVAGGASGATAELAARCGTARPAGIAGTGAGLAGPAGTAASVRDEPARAEAFFGDLTTGLKSGRSSPAAHRAPRPFQNAHNLRISTTWGSWQSNDHASCAFPQLGHSSSRLRQCSVAWRPEHRRQRM